MTIAQTIIDNEDYWFKLAIFYDTARTIDDNDEEHVIEFFLYEDSSFYLVVDGDLLLPQDKGMTIAKYFNYISNVIPDLMLYAKLNSYGEIKHHLNETIYTFKDKSELSIIFNERKIGNA